MYIYGFGSVAFFCYLRRPHQVDIQTKSTNGNVYRQAASQGPAAQSPAIAEQYAPPSPTKTHARGPRSDKASIPCGRTTRKPRTFAITAMNKMSTHSFIHSDITTGAKRSCVCQQRATKLWLMCLLWPSVSVFNRVWEVHNTTCNLK